MAVIRGTNGGERLNGTASRDYVYGLLGNDTIYGAGGNDQLSGNDGNDFLSGDAGDDMLRGGDGVDTLNGGDGNDQLDGGDDRDVDRLNGGAGDDFITAHYRDIVDGGTGVDTLSIGLDYDFDAAPKLYTINLSKIDGATYSQTGYEGVQARGIENAFVLLGNAKGGSSVTGSNGDDTIEGGVVEVGTKGHTLKGGAGDDHINGSDKADTIDGGSGTDFLSGGAGLDRITGGAGEDLFVLQLEATFPGGPAQAVDLILDFKPGEDHFLVQPSQLPDGLPFDLPTFDDADQTNPLVIGSAATSTAGGQFLYNTRTGILSYDHDGKGGDAAIALVKLVGAPTISATDFIFDF